MSREDKISRNVVLGSIILLLLIIMMSSCGSSKGCDGKKKFKTEMN